MANEIPRRDRPAWRANLTDPPQTVVIVGAARTAIGKYAGAFKNTPAHELGAAAIGAAMERAGGSRRANDRGAGSCRGTEATHAHGGGSSRRLRTGNYGHRAHLCHPQCPDGDAHETQ
jgi:Thiolase, N-terminal domain